MARILSAFAVVLLMTASACGTDGPDTADGPTVRDSAGVRVVESPADGTADAPWRVAAEPDWRVGWEESGPVQLERVRSGALLSDGRVVVADQGSSTLFYLAADGAVDTVSAGRGEGPGEFTFLAELALLPGDSILGAGWDGRWNIFGPEGRLGRTVRYTPSTRSFILTPKSAAPDGSLLLTTMGWSPRRDGDQGIPWLEAPVLRLAPDGTGEDTLAVLPLAMHYLAPSGFPSGRTTGDMAFTAGWPGGFVWAANTDPEVRWYDYDGTLRQLARWNPQRTVIDDAWWAEHTRAYEALVEGGPEGNEEVMRRVREGLEAERAVADRVPLFRGLWVDRGGNVWLGDYVPQGQEPEGAVVIGADGTVLGHLALPDRCRPLDLTDTHLLCIQYDAFDVPAVARFRIEK